MAAKTMAASHFEPKKSEPKKIFSKKNTKREVVSIEPSHRNFYFQVLNYKKVLTHTQLLTKTGGLCEDHLVFIFLIHVFMIYNNLEKA